MANFFDNPMGLMGFEFVEFASPTPNLLEPLFEKMGFSLVAKHRSKDVVLYRQGDINFVVNREPKSPAAFFAAEHGPSACAMAFRVRDIAPRLQTRAGTRRPAGGHTHRADGAETARDQGHRRRPAVPDRPLRGRQEHL